ncbi:DNA repair protein RecN [Carnobacterium divergens]|uniref:DNA repair protein RecN n=1 Tax=Carnobacterium divergens TaxID=2748 RepID=UPI0010717B61|nr:DNA repair protein RecN [Carnobacterium divergens]MDT1995507.1 DNA repair protein RecN [Carnobacterium divergens]TFI63017.1 DNA repair protein RecN [Carnobacterium divergens]TFI63369.1 DNA repair protein RecN [Carnobacterium divergens]TFI66234.1 DNA repair protein RecN [Carnobacterium divergens]TFI77656.1 DNA repair protein RecN [Carnobacterium divergens]
MLQELAIKNFAIIHDLSLSFENGMTVLTGETGAGKSIIIDAVGLLAGGRGSSEFIRHGESKCVLEGLFSLNKEATTFDLLKEYDIDFEDHTVLIQRDIHRNGKNVCRVNGRLVNIATLRLIGETMIDIHGQNEHQELMNPERHLGMLDQFGNETLSRLKADYHQTYLAYQTAKITYEKWQNSEQELAQRMDMLAYQTNDIELAELVVGEDDLLEEEKNLLVNYQRIVGALSVSYDALQGEEGSGIDLIGSAMTEMSGIEEIDGKYKQISESISNSYFQLQEAASDILKEMDQLAYDENRLNEIEKRLELIHQMKRKYGDSLAEIMNYYEKITIELSQIKNREDHIYTLTTELKELSEQLTKKGQVLSKKRQEVAKGLEISIHEQLKELYMEKVIFEVRFLSKETNGKSFNENGIDQVEFYIATNPGEPLKPLAKVASGGELSRMMLAMKTIFSKNLGITSIIFDEVDTGVSGRVAQAIANKIYLVAVHSQVLCITHLPQVAAMADHHLFISKTVVGERTETHVDLLKKSAKVQEIARMLAGTEITKLTLEHAKELLELAKTEKHKYI